MKKVASFVATTLTFGFLSITGITAIPFTMPAFQALWSVSEALFQCFEDEEYDAQYQERRNNLFVKVQRLQSLLENEAPQLMYEINAFAEKLEALKKKGILNVDRQDIVDVIDIYNCMISEARELYPEACSVQLMEAINDLGQDIRQIAETVEQRPKRSSLFGSIVNLGKSVLELLGVLDVSFIADSFLVESADSTPQLSDWNSGYGRILTVDCPQVTPLKAINQGCPVETENSSPDLDLVCPPQASYEQIYPIIAQAY
ncbi:MAG: hypothetical protein ABG776_08840 [Cyanobacteria bacterium J06555_13]